MKQLTAAFTQALVLAMFHVTLVRAHEPKALPECQTITEPGSYILTSNLPGPAGLLSSGDCLMVGTDFVTIDLNGFVITGRSGEGAGIKSQHHEGIAIRNGTVTAFATGVLLDGSASIVEGIRALRNSEIGILVTSTAPVPAAGGGIVKNNTATLNGTGIAARGLVVGNVSSTNVIGMFIYAGSTVLDNVVQFNGTFGFQIVCPSNIRQNTSTNALRSENNNIFLFPARREQCVFGGNLGRNFTEAQ
jgi:hypothetical protein